MKKTLQIIAIILGVILIIALIYVLRNYIIIRNLQSKISEYSNKTTYSMKSIAKQESGTTVTMDYYIKDDKQAVFIDNNMNGEISKGSIYKNGDNVNTYIEGKGKKIATLNNNNTINVNIDIYNYLETKNNWQTFLGSIKARIKSEKYNDKKGYNISNFMSSTSLTTENTEIWIEKETGLCKKITEDNNITEKTYDFNDFNDSIFVEPDINQYEIE